jgi:glucose/arabinose dehydrogenase
VRVVSAAGKLREEPFAEVEVVRLETYSEHGLLGLALDPDFGENGYVYVMYSVPNEDGKPLKQVVVRFRDVDGKGEDETVIVDDLRVGPTCCHNGGRLAFGPDGKLYVTIGDTEVEGLAQIATSRAGAILRFNADGTVPEDNPLEGEPAWAWGLRNPFGIAFAEDGTLYATDNGPAGFDEVNRIERAVNYGWPEVTGTGDNPRYRNPLYSSVGERIAPTGIAVYSGDDLPQYEGQLFFCSYLEEKLTRAVVGEGSLELFDTGERCLLDVTVGPDGALYFSDLTTVYRWGR